VAVHDGGEPHRGGVQIAAGSCTRPRKVAHGSSAPVRARRAKCTASRRSVVTRAAGFGGRSAGAPTQQS
jgi:hypothetical protein